MKRPILFIHGFAGGKYEFRPIINHLKNKGFSKFYQFTYKKRFCQIPIRVIAKQLSDFVTSNISEDKIDIIGISQGGIIAEYYLKHFNKKEIRTLFTLCTPHKGSIMAYISGKPGFIDLRPRSKVLIEAEEFMKKSKTKLFSVYTPFDLMVFPGWNANPGHGKIKKVYAPLHPLAFWIPSTLKFISKNL
jgi:triacylglycerol lipase